MKRRNANIRKSCDEIKKEINWLFDLYIDKEKRSLMEKGILILSCVKTIEGLAHSIKRTTWRGDNKIKDTIYIKDHKGVSMGNKNFNASDYPRNTSVNKNKHNIDVSLMPDF